MADFDLDSILEQTLHEFEEQEANAPKSSITQAQQSSHNSDAPDIVTNHPCNSAVASDPSLSSMSSDRVSAAAQSNTSTTSDEDIEGIFEQLTQHFIEGVKQPIETEERDETNGKEDDEQYDNIMSSVIQQLLNKEMMYEPTRLICEKFPPWIEENRGKLSEDEIAKYAKMYDCFQRVRTEYELEVPNYTRLTDLMFEVQQYGQPPTEIMQGVAPGLMFDSSGLPSFTSQSKPTNSSSSKPKESRSSDKASAEDDDDDDDDDELPELPPGFSDEIASKIASGDCPTM